MRKKASALALAYMALLSCGGVEKDTSMALPVFPGLATPSTASDPSRPQVRVVVVAIDGARWQEVFGGTDAVLAHSSGLRPAEAATADELVPNIRALARRGVALGGDETTRFDASGPNFVSLPGYTEILTGRPAPCQENACEARPERTLADEVRALPGVTQREVAVISSWERIDAVAAGDPSSIVVSAGRTHGATRALLAEDRGTAALLHSAERAESFPGHDDYRPDRDTAAIATSYFEHERPRFMFVSLGDSDEYAHAGNYRSYLDALRRADAFVGDLVRISKGWGREGADVVFFVTADHGRSFDFREHGRNYPESARTWLIAAGGPLAQTGYLTTLPGAEAHLRDIAPTVREIVGIAPDTDRLAGGTLTSLFDPEGSSILVGGIASSQTFVGPPHS